jgi:hypothetical protein
MLWPRTPTADQFAAAPLGDLEFTMTPDSQFRVFLSIQAQDIGAKIASSIAQKGTGPIAGNFDHVQALQRSHAISPSLEVRRSLE